MVSRHHLLITVFVGPAGTEGTAAIRRIEQCCAVYEYYFDIIIVLSGGY